MAKTIIGLDKDAYGRHVIQVWVDHGGDRPPPQASADKKVIRFRPRQEVMARIIIDPEHPEWLAEVIWELSSFLGEISGEQLRWEEVPAQDIAQTLIDYCETVTWGLKEDDEEKQ